MRTIIDLPKRQIEALARIGKRRRLSRAELIRQAVERYLVEHAPESGAAFGLWKRAGAAENGLAFQQRLRRDWGR
jgi:metal-responsive CopG/Arc/MetJ family transcriptional regulator